MFEVLRALSSGLKRTTVQLALSDKLICADFTNVSHYYFRHDREVWELEHFPGCLSPWPLAWIEWQSPGLIYSKEMGEQRTVPLGWGVQVIRVPVNADGGAPDDVKAAAYYQSVSHATYAANPDPVRFLADIMETYLRGVPFVAGARWFTSFTVMCPRFSQSAVAVLATVHNERGDALPIPGLGRSYCVGVPLPPSTTTIAPLLATSRGGIGGLTEGERELFTTQGWINFVDSQALKISLLGFSLANCKNVTHERERLSAAASLSPRRAKFNRKAAAGDGLGRVTYRTLRIEPMTARGRRDQAEAELLAGGSRLHICRGHFKDFREKGLFGKLHGLYWWESQLRGNPERGRVHKDYAV